MAELKQKHDQDYFVGNNIIQTKKGGWIGLKRQGEGWQWVTSGQPLSESTARWADHQPFDGDCVIMCNDKLQTGCTRAGEWLQYDCGDISSGFYAQCQV